MIHYKICAVHNRNYTLGQADRKLYFGTGGSIIILNKRIKIQVDLDMSNMDILMAAQRQSKGVYVVSQWKKNQPTELIVASQTRLHMINLIWIQPRGACYLLASSLLYLVICFLLLRRRSQV